MREPTGRTSPSASGASSTPASRRPTNSEASLHALARWRYAKSLWTLGCHSGRFAGTGVELTQVAEWVRTGRAPALTTEQFLFLRVQESALAIRRGMTVPMLRHAVLTQATAVHGALGPMGNGTGGPPADVLEHRSAAEVPMAPLPPIPVRGVDLPPVRAIEIPVAATDSLRSILQAVALASRGVDLPVVTPPAPTALPTRVMTEPSVSPPYPPVVPSRTVEAPVVAGPTMVPLAARHVATPRVHLPPPPALPMRPTTLPDLTAPQRTPIEARMAPTIEVTPVTFGRQVADAPQVLPTDVARLDVETPRIVPVIVGHTQPTLPTVGPLDVAHLAAHLPPLAPVEVTMRPVLVPDVRAVVLHHQVADVPSVEAPALGAQACPLPMVEPLELAHREARSPWARPVGAPDTTRTATDAPVRVVLAEPLSDLQARQVESPVVSPARTGVPPVIESATRIESAPAWATEDPARVGVPVPIVTAVRPAERTIEPALAFPTPLATHQVPDAPVRDIPEAPLVIPGAPIRTPVGQPIAVARAVVADAPVHPVSTIVPSRPVTEGPRVRSRRHGGSWTPMLRRVRRSVARMAVAAVHHEPATAALTGRAKWGRVMTESGWAVGLVVIGLVIRPMLWPAPAHPGLEADRPVAAGVVQAPEVTTVPDWADSIPNPDEVWGLRKPGARTYTPIGGGAAVTRVREPSWSSEDRGATTIAPALVRRMSGPSLMLYALTDDSLPARGTQWALAGRCGQNLVVQGRADAWSAIARDAGGVESGWLFGLAVPTRQCAAASERVIARVQPTTYERESLLRTVGAMRADFGGGELQDVAFGSINGTRYAWGVVRAANERITMVPAPARRYAGFVAEEAGRGWTLTWLYTHEGAGAQLALAGVFDTDSDGVPEAVFGQRSVDGLTQVMVVGRQPGGSWAPRQTQPLGEAQ